jgi:hypothetical protein
VIAILKVSLDYLYHLRVADGTSHLPPTRTATKRDASRATHDNQYLKVF